MLNLICGICAKTKAQNQQLVAIRVMVAQECTVSRYEIVPVMTHRYEMLIHYR